MLLDENIEHEVHHRLENLGHDVEHVDFVGALGKGATDSELAAFSKRTDRTIVTYDDDFIEATPPSQYRATIFFEDDTMSAKEVAEIVHEMSKAYPHDQVIGLQKAGREWL
ncbi:MAG: DUF5615 family PIN-like protein [Haloferacaceae archaeon]